MIKTKQPFFFTDIDGTLLDFISPACTLLTTITGKEFGPQDQVHFDFQESLGAFSIHIKEFWESIWDLPLTSYDGAEDFVVELKKRGCYVMGVTQRPSSESKVASYRDSRKLNLDSLYILSRKEKKSDIINRHIEIGLHSHLFFLDDKIQNVIDVQENCTEKVHVFLLNRPWNQSLDVAGYQRVDGYEEVLRKVDEILR
jgi:hypothetical protein